MSPPDPQASSRWHRPALWLLLTVALGLRLCYASDDPSAARIYDERFAIENIVAIVHSGSLEPANGFHPALSYLPATAVIAAAEGLHTKFGWPAESPVAGRDLSATGYLLGRALHALLGMLTVWLAVVLGDRVFAAPVGLWSGLLIACAPLHIRQTAILNEDVILAASVLLAAHATLSALAHPTARRFFLAGTSFGLALAGKFNGGVFSLPFAAVSLWRGRRDRRQILWLCLAVVASLATFWVLNPYLPTHLDLYRKDFGQTAANYDQRGARLGSWRVVLHAAQTMARPELLGPLLGYLGLATLLTTAALLLLKRPPAPERERWYLLTSFPATYVVALALPAVWVTGHQWLPLLPFWAIAAVQALRLAARRLPRPRLLVPALALPLALAVLHHGILYVRNSVVETPGDCAAAFLARQLAPGPALAFTEVPLRGIRSEVLRGVVAVEEIAALAAVATERRFLADAWVFPERRLAEPAYAGSLAGTQVLHCPPSFWSDGEELVAVARQFAQSSSTTTLALLTLSADVQSASFAAPARELVSFLVTVPRKGASGAAPELRINGALWPLTWQGATRGRTQYLSQRVWIGSGDQTISLTLPGWRENSDRVQRRPQVKLLRWLPPPSPEIAVPAQAALR